ncbi:hypothetical protein VPH35_103007 [Triticum aestivum]|uniref:DUF4220 domain-containing protein n=2 Tax=Triticum TaxID=4564 RepID=A0A9R0XU05_TRITD|nr:unnamed protein product [Triticum turgidum subsp. durum]
MARGAEELVVFWKEWGIQALVLLSFTLQVILLITAEIRPLIDSGMLRAIVWLAYQLADTTAIYVLGHMSVIGSQSLPEHQLMAFWAPFLLLHLGGQDNITAYSIEDNRLWMRHLQIFAVQVLAAGYVLYESSLVLHQTLLRQAAILMFVVGVVKYGERVWALKRASSSNLSGKNYQSFGTVHIRNRGVSVIISGHNYGVMPAHQLLCFPMHLLKGPLPLVALGMTVLEYEWSSLYQMAEVQLSIMYDIFYSKAPVIHTWYGICIRVMSPLATITAFMLLRRFSDEDGDKYNAVDVAGTYVLLAGAIILEITSLLRAMFSSWAQAAVLTIQPFQRYGGNSCVGLVKKTFCSYLLYLVSLPRALLSYAMSNAGLPLRYWSGSMGQHNFIHLCTDSRDNRSSKIARWMGREDLWNMLVYTQSIPVPEDFSHLLDRQLRRSVSIIKESPDHIQNSRGQAALKRMGIPQEELVSWSVGIELDESILVWHIATHVYLSWHDERYPPRPALADTIQVLSNYMFFLLAARPHMLPNNASRQRYIELCNKVVNCLKYSSAEDLVSLIRERGKALDTPEIAQTLEHDPSRSSCSAEETNGALQENLTFDRASQLGEKLIDMTLDTPATSADMLDLISQVWMEMLCYVSYRCTPDSHARQLSNGGEITTVVAILMEYMKSDIFDSKRVGLTASDRP